MNRKKIGELVLVLVFVCAAALLEAPDICFAGTSGEETTVGKSVKRISGTNRYDTMESISSSGFNTSESIVIASGDNYPDALSASALAGVLQAPVLLTNRDSLTDQAETEIRRLGASHAIVVGGPNALSYSILRKLSDMGLTVERRYGQTRQETASEVAKRVAAITRPDTVVVASGSSPFDALSVSPYSYVAGAPVLLVDGVSRCLSDGTLRGIENLSTIKRAVIVGGTAVVDAEVENQLASLGIKVVRWAGRTRYETSRIIAESSIASGVLSADVVGVASGENYPDALAGGALLGSRKGALILSPVGGVAEDLFGNFLSENKNQISKCFILGGTSALYLSVDKAVRTALGLQADLITPEESNGKTVLYFLPHQDDEVLSMGVSAFDMASLGYDIHAVLCTDGSNSYVRGLLDNGKTCAKHSGTHSYNLTANQFVNARDAEFTDSCIAIGYKQENIHISKERSADGSLTVEGATRILETYLELYPDSIVCTLSPLVGVNQHSDHAALGEAAMLLYRQGTIKDLRLFIEPYNIDAFQRDNPLLQIERTDADGGDCQLSMDAACMSYGEWDPSNNRYAIGYHSVTSDFDDFMNNSCSWWYSARDVSR